VKSANFSRLSSEDEILEHIIIGRPILDVRAPIEFSQGHVPGSSNIPLLDDAERAKVGTTYKNDGPVAALNQGYGLISGDVQKRRVADWCAFLDKNSDAAVMCFRGGQRSQLVQAELLRHGYDKPLIEGGFKRVRRLLVEQVDRACQTRKWSVLSGYTGTGKTRILRAASTAAASMPALAFLDLESAAKHRGSSFGPWTEPQPAPVTFENRLGVDICRLLKKNESETIWIEDESRSIGKRVLPLNLFKKISESKVWILERSRHDRTVDLTDEYLSQNYDLKDGVVPNEDLARRVRHDISRAVLNIERRLGGSETKNVLAMTDDASNEFALYGRFSAHWPWVERILETYYDPLYERHLGLIADRVIGRGPEEAFHAFVSR
jgi:tRNA 2-selenouridine synthase